MCTDVSDADCVPSLTVYPLLPDDIQVSPECESHQSHASKLSPIDEEHKGFAKHVLRLSKGRKKDEKDKVRSKDSRKDSDSSSIKSLVLNGEGLESVGVSVVKSLSKVPVDTVELWPLGRTRYAEDHPLSNGNNSSTHSKPSTADRGGGGEGELRSRPNSFHGAMVNPESFSTDL